MPMIQVHHERGSVPAALKAQLAQGLTDVIIEIEGGGAVDGPAARSIAYVLFSELGEGDFVIGGTVGDDTYVEPPGKFLVDVRVPEGSMNAARKTAVHQRVDEVFRDVFDLGPATTPRTPSILITINEWAEGGLGAMGRTYRLADIGAYVGVGNPEVRDHSQAYMTARARARAAADFPE